MSILQYYLLSDCQQLWGSSLVLMVCKLDYNGILITNIEISLFYDRGLGYCYETNGN